MTTLPRDGVYWTLWRTPPIRGQAFLGLFAQLTQGAAPIGLVLAVHQATGSLVLAGAVSAALWIMAAVARPIQGRLIDRRGSRAVMLVCGPLHGLALIGLVVAAESGGPAWSLVVLSGLAGAALPPVSTTMRVEWAKRLPPVERTAAYSLVYLTQEIAVLTGPLVVAALVALQSAALALIVAAVISGVASVAFGLVSSSGASDREVPRSTRRTRSAAVPALLGTGFLMGCMLGALQVATPALALSHRAPALGGVLIAALSVGGIAGALVYGGRRWALDPSGRLLGLLCVVGIAVTPMAFVALPLLVAGLLLGLVGLALNPALTTTSLLVDRHSASRAAEAFGWMSTALGGGTAAGSAVAGALAQHNGVVPAYLAAAVAAYGAVVIAALARSRLRHVPIESAAQVPGALGAQPPIQSPR
jgi:MFS family permease